MFLSMRPKSFIIYCAARCSANGSEYEGSLYDPLDLFNHAVANGIIF